MWSPEDRAEWIANRASYIGASDAAAAVGLSPWGDPISLWEQKLGLAPGPDESFRMKLGTLIEPIIGDLYEESTGRKLRRPDGAAKSPPEPVRHKAHAFLGANPDFVVIGEPGLVQAKLAVEDTFGDPDEPKAGGIPLHYRVQGWAEMLVTGREWVDFAVLNPRSGLRIYPMQREDFEGEIADLEADLVDYWQSYVVPAVMPPPTAQSGPALARRFPRPETPIGKIASAGQEVKLRELVDAQEAEKAAKEHLERLKNEAKAMIGDAAFIEGLGRRFTWSKSTRTDVEWRLVAGSFRAAIEEARGMLPEAQTAYIDGLDLDTIESLYTSTTESTRFTIGK